MVVSGNSSLNPYIVLGSNSAQSSRFICNDVVDTVIRAFDKGYLMPTEPWLSQANHIFSDLRISSNFEDYGMSSTQVDMLFTLICPESCTGMYFV
jgi:hypothetical protein